MKKQKFPHVYSRYAYDLHDGEGQSGKQIQEMLKRPKTKNRFSMRLLTTLSCAIIMGVICAHIAFGAVFADKHENSKVIGHDGGTLQINADVSATIPPGALTGYLEEEGIDNVEISVVSVEKYASDERDTLVSVWFKFGPSGCYFDPPLELSLGQKYLEGGVILSSEDDELLEFTLDVDEIPNEISTVFFIPHFSCYYYEEYCY